MMNFPKLFFYISIIISVTFPGSVCATTTNETTAHIQKTKHPSVVMVIAYFHNGTHVQATGFFINHSGDVATTYHAVSNATQVKIKTSDNTHYTVRKIKRIDNNGDIAILSVDIPPDKVFPVIFAQHPPNKGDKIHIVGHPLGHSQSMTEGLVSSLYKVVNFDNLIQFTAPIEIGSSGSPLFNKHGKVIGIACFMLFSGKYDTPLNFAIPSHRIARLMY